jgi:FKBP-type peptidyl-prolyl cis-trans isomerase FkpA
MRRQNGLITAALTVSLTACASGGGVVPPVRPMESIPFASTLDVQLDKMTKTSTGLRYRDLEVGTGPVVKEHMDIGVVYTGWLTNGVKFDSTAAGQKPLTIPIGRGRVIKGWDEGIIGMRVGGRRQLIVPSELAYGSNRAGLIPPDAVLVFDVRVISAK